jgi:methyl-accepting chemotaxis protein WspA
MEQLMPKNMSLQMRIITAFLLVGLIVLIVAVIGWSGNARLSGHIHTFADNAMPSINNLWKVNEAQARVRSGERALVISSLSADRRQKELTNIQNAWKDINEGFNGYEKLRRDPKEDQIYTKVKTEWEKWKSAHEEFIRLHDQFLKADLGRSRQVQFDLLRQGKTNTPEFAAATAAVDLLNKMNDYTFTTLDPAFETSTNALLELLSYNVQLGENAKKSADADVSRSTFWILVGLLIGPTTAILFGIYFSNTIAKPLGAKIAGVVGVAQKISTGDLTTQVQVAQTSDEIGQLQSAFRTMTDSLNTLIRQVQRTGIQITTSATQIAASGKQLEATLSEQAASTNEVAATAKEIAATSSQLVKTMDEVGYTSQATAQAATDSQQDISHMEKTMKTLAEATNTISTKLGVISEKANNINSIVTTITKVADQTNLLSLNAAIEAEKAGEYGTGFAVVAREIRRLADQTAVATLDIENMVREMQGAVSTGVMEMDKFTKDVERGVDDVRNIGSTLESIISKVQILTPRFQQVSNSVEAQSQGAVQISEAMVQLSEASSQSAVSLREVNGAIAQLTEAAQTLRQEVSRFKVASNY